MKIFNNNFPKIFKKVNKKKKNWNNKIKTIKMIY